MSRTLWQGVGALVLGARVSGRGRPGGGFARLRAGQDLPGRLRGRLGADRPAARVRARRRGRSSTRPRRSSSTIPTARARRRRLRPEVAAGYSGLARRAHLHVHDPARLPLQRRRACDGEELRLCDRPRCQPRPRLARSVVHHRSERHGHRRGDRRQRRQGDARTGASWRRAPPGDPLTRRDPTLLTKLRDAVLPGDLAQAAADEEVVAGGYPSAGPYAFTQNTPNTIAQLRRNPYYRGLRPPRKGVVRPLEPRPAGRLPAGRGRQPRRGTAAGRRGSRGRAQVRRQQEPLLGRADQLRRLRRDEQPAARCSGSSVALRQALNWMIDRRALLAPLPPYTGSPVDPPAALVRYPARSPRRAAAVPRRAERPQGPPARGRPPAGGARERRLPQLGAWRPGAGRSTRDVLVKLGVKAERIKLKGVHRGGHLQRDREAERRPRSRRLARLVLRVPGAAGTALPRVQRAPGPPGRSSNPGSARSKRLHGAARLRALGRLDLDLISTLAPVAVTRTYNGRLLLLTARRAREPRLRRRLPGLEHPRAGAE